MRDAPGPLRQAFQRQAYCVIDDILSISECEKVLSKIENYRREHSLQRIRRKVRERSLDYFVIDGNQIVADLPDLCKISADLNHLVNALDDLELVPLADLRAAINVNITAPGGEYRWHYDRNRVTALLYLNEVNGGEIEFCPRYRWKFASPGLSFLQEVMDSALRQKWIRRLLTRTVRVQPMPGRLLVMRGDICLHSVRPVTGDAWRLNLVMAYDPPDSRYGKSEELDRYLYDAESS